MSILIEPPIAPSPETLVNLAIERMQTVYPNWKPNPASAEYRMMLAYAAIASEVGILAIDVPEEIIRFVGEVIYRVSPRAATRATVITKWMSNSLASIPAGTVVYLTPEGGSP